MCYLCTRRHFTCACTHMHTHTQEGPDLPFRFHEFGEQQAAKCIQAGAFVNVEVRRKSMRVCVHAYTHMCMYLCMHDVVCMFAWSVFAHTRVHVHTYKYARMYVCLHPCMSVSMYACTFVCFHACMHACMHACTHASTHVCVCVYARAHVCACTCLWTYGQYVRTD